MTGTPRRYPIRTAVGLAALAILGLMAVVLPRWGRVSCPAVVEAGRVFTLSSIEPGRYRCSLRSGRPARGYELIQESVLQFERSDLVRMEILPGVSTGDRVSAGTPVAAVNSLRNERRLGELEAQREVLGAQKDLLEAGSRIEEIREAERRVQVAMAEREAARAELERVRSLSELKLVSDAELDVAERAEDVSRLEVEVARAEMDTVRSAARPEELAAMEAQRVAVDAGIEETRALLGEEIVLCPIDGIAEAGVEGDEIQVYDLTTVYIKIPVPDNSRSRVKVGDAIRFESPSAPGVVHTGQVVDVAPSMSVLNDRWVLWVSARVENPSESLYRGMAGTAEILPAGEGNPIIETLVGALR